MEKVLRSFLSLFLITLIFGGNKVGAEEYSAVEHVHTQEVINFSQNDHLKKIVPQVELKHGLMDDLSNLNVISYINQVLERNPLEQSSSEKSVTTEDFLFRFEGEDGNSKATLVSYTGQNRAVVIPREVVKEGWESPSEVVAISISAFQSKGVTSVEIPDTIKEIGSGAFSFNELQDIRIPDSVVSLGSLAFANNELKTVQLSKSLSEIYEGTFIGNQLKAVEIPNSIRKIGHMAFASNELEQIALPASLLTVEELAFSWNPLKNIYAESESEATRITEILNPLSMANVTKLTILGTTTIKLFELDNLTTLNWIPVAQEGLTFSFTGTDGNSEARVTGYMGESDNVVIPKMVINREAGWSQSSLVTRIDNNAFYNCGLTQLTLPNSLKTIGSQSFMLNKLENLTLPDSVVTVSEQAFSQNLLTELKLSNSVTSIGESAFEGNALRSVVIPDNVVYLYSRVFANNKIEKVFLPTSIRQVWGELFSGNPLKNIYVESENDASIMTKLLNVNAMSGVTESTILGTNNTNLFRLDQSKNINWIPINQNELIFKFSGVDGNSEAIVTGFVGDAKSIIIPNEVVNHEQGWVIPSPVKVIGNRAFLNNGLTDVVIPSTVLKLESYSFYGNNLKNIILPQSVTTIEEGTFQGNDLTTIEIPNSIKIIGESSFSDNQLTTLTIPGSVTEIGDRAFGNNKIMNANIGESVDKIGYAAFYGNPLKMIYGESVSEAIKLKKILNTESMNGVTELTILGTIGNKLFQLDNLIDGNWVSTTSNFRVSFSGTDGNSEATLIGYTGETKDIIIPSEVVNHEQGWVVPSPVRVIGSHAFSEKGITSVIIPNTVIEIKSYAFSGNYLKKLELPDSIITLDNGVFVGNEIETISLPESLKRIGWGAFMDNQLTSIKIPNSVLTIEGRAFFNNKLYSITMGNSVEKIEESIFYSNPLENIYVESGLEGDRLINILTPLSMTGVTKLTQLRTTGMLLYRLNDFNNRQWYSVWVS